MVGFCHLLKSGPLNCWFVLILRRVCLRHQRMKQLLERYFSSVMRGSILHIIYDLSLQSFNQIGTFLTILFLNIWLLHVIAEKKRMRRKLQASEISGDSSTSERGALIMLGSCVLLYLFTQTPALVDKVLSLLDKLCVRQKNMELRPFLAPVWNFLLNLNYSINFVLYCGANRKFREKVRKLFYWKISRPPSLSEQLLQTPLDLTNNWRLSRDTSRDFYRTGTVWCDDLLSPNNISPCMSNENAVL